MVNVTIYSIHGSYGSYYISYWIWWLWTCWGNMKLETIGFERQPVFKQSFFPLSGEGLSILTKVQLLLLFFLLLCFPSYYYSSSSALLILLLIIIIVVSFPMFFICFVLSQCNLEFEYTLFLWVSVHETSGLLHKVVAFLRWQQKHTQNNSKSFGFSINIPRCIISVKPAPNASPTQFNLLGW